ncbi:MAG TPA: metallophosphoesterase family protein [Anaerolineales bacterium]|nr:metallophosphoesterase family protein [Anaerolineales bacterium]
MRVLVISDIHANYTALEAVITGAGQVDETWCLGDLVGYGPDPNAVVEQVRELPHLTCIMGNHDMAIIGKMALESFNGDARRSLTWTEKVLNSDNMNFLRSLPQSTKVRGEVTMAHGSPRDPLWEYVLNTLTARLNFDHFDTPFCFIGHSHIQSLFRLNEGNDRVTLESVRVDQPITLTPRTMVNPGSVGQPRDRDPRAAYAVYDTETRQWEAHRAVYDIQKVQTRMREIGLPEKHAVRLGEGW